MIFQHKSTDGLEQSVRFPTFETSRVLSSVTLADGSYALAGVQVRKSDPDKRLLVMC